MKNTLLPLLLVSLGLSAFGQAPVFVTTRNGAVSQPTTFWQSNRLAILATLSLDVPINDGAPNGTGALVHWSRLTGVPAGFADGTDDGTSGGSGTVTSVGMASTVLGLGWAGLPITTSGIGTLTGIVAVASGGTGSTTQDGARLNLGLGSAATNSATAFEPAGVSASDITDSTAAGRALLTAGNVAAQITALGTASLYEPLGAAAAAAEANTNFVALRVGSIIATNLYLTLDPYDSGWGASSNAASQKDVYDKIESLPLGGLTSIQVNGTSGATNLGNSGSITWALSGGVATPSLSSNLTLTSLTVPTLNVTGASTLTNVNLVGNPTVPTATPGDNDTSAANTAFVAAIAATLEPLNSAKYQATNAYLTEVGNQNGGSLTNLNGSSVATGTVADARIASTIARDDEVTAAVAPKANATNAVFTGSFRFTQTELLPHSTVTNFVADFSGPVQQTILATNLVVKFLHATNVAAGAMKSFIVRAGTNATVRVELPRPAWECNTNVLVLTANQSAALSLTGYSPDNNTNVIALLSVATSR